MQATRRGPFVRVRPLFTHHSSDLYAVPNASKTSHSALGNMTNTQTFHRVYSAPFTAVLRSLARDRGRARSVRALLIAATCLAVACGGSRDDTGSENDPNGARDGGNHTGDGGGAVSDGDGGGGTNGPRDGGGGVKTDGGGGDMTVDAGGCQTACAGDDCGQVPDGCGGFLSCSQCGQGLTCGQNAPNKCGAPPPVTCTPLLAADVCPGKCGAVSDGCSSVITCSTANGGLSCGDTQFCQGSTCVDQMATCSASTCATKNHACGQDGDGCGGVIDCGACGAGTQCEFAAPGNTCKPIPPPACVKVGIAQACAMTCGMTGDGCGGQYNCEDSPSSCAARLPAGQTCGGGGVANQCGSGSASCVPTLATTVCAGQCGNQSDGCGGAYTCDASNGGQVCNAAIGETCGGGGVASSCGKPACVPKTQAVACPGDGTNKSCGQQPDGCGGLVDCGGCATDQQCGLVTASICGTVPSCQPVAVASACSGKCGMVPDGCGGSYNCSAANGGVSCTGNEYCGANSLPNQCGAPPVSCVPKTCAQLGHSCGLASDGCGHVLNCWPSCATTDPTCTGSCATDSSCISNGSGAQACVMGAPTCTGSLCSTVPTNCAANSPTTLTGTVLTPGIRVNNQNLNRLPVPNALVYIPADPNVVLPTIVEGITPGDAASCGRCGDEKLVADGQSVLAAAVTDYRGAFTLSGRIPVGTKFKLVVKVGKWRRMTEVAANVASACTTATLGFDDARLPANSTDGLAGTHLPKVAVSTGSVDEMECVFRNLGVSESEFTLPSATGRMHMYRANGARTTGDSCPAGCSTTDCVKRANGCRFSNDEHLLWGDQTNLNKYDLVVWDCVGAEEQHDTDEPKIETYVNNGGRMFASHFSYTWIEGNGTLNASAAWRTGGSTGSGTGFISLPSGNTARTGANVVKSPAFRDWLDYQGALTGTVPGALSNPPQATPQFTISDPRDRAGATVGPATDEWVYRNARFCSNNSGLLCTQDSTCNNICSNEGGRACTRNQDCRNGGTCRLGGTCLAAEKPRVQQLSFNTPYAASEANICGRVAYSGFHVSNTDNSGNNAFFPGVCANAALTAQEKILAYMLFDLSTCVSAGDPPQPPACAPKTPTDLCPGVNDACGYVSDGCGGVVDCAGCAGGYYCDGNTCRPQQCTPTTCASLGFTCGNHADGCGGIARNASGVEGCGTCAAGQTCGLTSPGICGGCVQIPKATACPTNSCGMVSDGCGGTHDCGICTTGVCGGGGPNTCGNSTCTQIPQATACLNKNCGVVADGCGGTYSCGVCTAPDTCGGAGSPNNCGHPVCTPKTTQQACSGLSCGFVSDGCGGAINCGTCPNNGVCGGAGPNQCGASCQPTTCTIANATCGAVADACGGLLNCGTCPAGQTCGAVTPNQCGTGVTCTPRSCVAANAQCGLIGDGCGAVLDCGLCTPPQTCGGAGVANQCGTGTSGCNKLTCPGQHVQCGAATDGCGGLLDCGGCPSGYSCDQGMCVVVPI